MGPRRHVVPVEGPDPVAADRAAPHHSPTTPMHPRQQRKGGGTRAWLVVVIDGESRVEEVGKHAIMRRAGLLARDLRILDPMLSYPSTVLGRERAIVVKLEHIKAIITANEVLVLNSKDPLVSRFARDLQLRVSGGLSNSLAKAPENSETDVEAVETSSNHSPPLNGCSMEPPAMVTPPQFGSSVTPGVKDRNGWATNEIPKAATSRDLPFEFRALEVCLECACRCFESETSTLEQEAYPALDELTSKISTLNLEHVRQIKSRLVAISGRVQKVRDELEQLLDDDMDMAEMYLTEKLKQQQLAETSSLDEIDNDAIIPHDDRDQNSMDEAGDSNKNLSFSPNIEELGMLLEAYFVQIDGTLNKLSTLREYVDDTEDYINIMLDDEQNQLLQMGVMLSTATLITSAGIVVTGVMGMNIHIGLFDTTPNNFWETAIATVVLCILLFIAAVVWGNRGGLLS